MPQNSLQLNVAVFSQYRRNRNQDDEAQIQQGEPHRDPKTWQHPTFSRHGHHQNLHMPGGLLCLAIGLVDLIEHASITEMYGVGLLPAAEHLIDREQADDWKVCRIERGH